MTEHALTQAMDRYGLNLMKTDLAALEVRLRAGEGVVCQRMRDGKEIRYIEVLGVLVRLVWHPKERLVVTFLPRRKQRTDVPRRRAPK